MKLIVGDGFTGKWFADEYDSRNSNLKKLGEVNTRKRVKFIRQLYAAGGGPLLCGGGSDREIGN